MRLRFDQVLTLVWLESTLLHGRYAHGSLFQFRRVLLQTSAEQLLVRFLGHLRVVNHLLVSSAARTNTLLGLMLLLLLVHLDGLLQLITRQLLRVLSYM